MTSKSFLMVDCSIHNQDLYYATGFLAEDKFLYLKSGDKEIILIPAMELGRARKESRISDIRTTTDYGAIEKIKQHGRERAYCLVVSELLRDEGITRVSVPHNFPIFIADELRSQGFVIEPILSPITKLRTIKTRNEIGYIKKAQICCEAAMQSAVGAIRKAEIRDGVLEDSGHVLTSERIRAVIEHTLIDCGCESHSTIVACGTDAADPHNTGTGVLSADENIVIDIFPRLRMERYCADMTRTVARGSPSQALLEMYDAVLDAQTAGIGMVRAGISGSDVHNAVCDVFEDQGYLDLFIHSTGHGVGLDVHEEPYIGAGGGMLEAGNVITIEPGLYDHKIGGIRIEDMVLVTKNGCETLTTMEKRFVV